MSYIYVRYINKYINTHTDLCIHKFKGKLFRCGYSAPLGNTTTQSFNLERTQLDPIPAA